MTAIIPEMDPTRPGPRRSAKILDAISIFGVTNLFGSPALLNRVGRTARRTGSACRRCGASSPPAPRCPPQVIERFATLLADGRAGLHALRRDRIAAGRVIGSDEILAETRHTTDRAAASASAARSRASTVKIIRISDEPIPTWTNDLELPAGEIGEIAVQGPCRHARLLQSSRVDRAGQDRRSRRRFLSSHGRCWLSRRTRPALVLRPQIAARRHAGGTLFTIPCEGVFNAHPAVFRTALVGVKRNGVTEPVICVGARTERLDAGGETAAANCSHSVQSHPHTANIPDDPVSSEFPGGYPAQRQDFPRKTGRLGRASGCA